MDEVINEMMTTVASLKRKFGDYAEDIWEDLHDLSLSSWDEKTSITNIRRMNALVIDWHKIACEVKGIEVLVSVDPDDFGEVKRLHKLIISCHASISSLECFLKHYDSFGAKKDGVLQIHNSMWSMYRSAQAMLDESVDWILLLRAERNKTSKPKKMIWLADETVSFKRRFSQMRALSQISEEGSQEDEILLTKEPEQTSSDAIKGTGPSGSVSTQQNVQDEDLTASPHFQKSCKECKFLCGDLDNVLSVITAGDSEVSYYIAAAKHFSVEMNVIMEAKNSLIDSLGENVAEFKNTVEWKELEDTFDQVLDAFAAKAKECAEQRRAHRSE